jgi:8-oxo-dGTP diphosphatase
MAATEGDTPRIRVAARALIIRDGAVLLQVCRIGGRVVHLLPGGAQEHGETLAEAARREVREETGLAVAVDALLWVREYIVGRHDPHGNNGHELACIFRGRLVGDATPTMGHNPDDAQVGVRWVPLEELADLTLWPEAVHRRLLALTTADLPLVPDYLGDCL